MARVLSFPTVGPWSTAALALVLLGLWGYLTFFHETSQMRLSSAVEAHQVETVYHPSAEMALRHADPGLTFPRIHEPDDTPARDYVVRIRADAPDVPGQATLNEGFRASVQFHVDVEADNREAADSGHDPGMAEIQQEIQRRLRVRLELAGVELQPQGLVRVGRDLRASWSVIASQPGNLRGQITTRLDPGELGDGIVPDQVPGTIPLEINVASSGFRLAGLVENGALGIGLLASIVSLVQFVWRWRDRRRRRLGR